MMNLKITFELEHDDRDYVMIHSDTDVTTENKTETIEAVEEALAGVMGQLAAVMEQRFKAEE